MSQERLDAVDAPLQDDAASNLQAICQVTRERAIELLDAASGSIQRAVDIHLQDPGSVGPEVVDMTEEGKDDDDEDSVCVVQPSLPAKRSRENGPPERTERISKSPQKKGTPHAACTPKGKQVTIQSFFGSKTSSPSSGRKIRKSSGNIALEERNERVSHIDVNNQLFSGPPNSGKQSTAPVKVDPRLSYSTLAKAFGQMTDTTKRNEKLNILKDTLAGIIQAVGGIHGQENPQSRVDDAKVLTAALELVAGKVTLGDETVAPAPLQISGAAVSNAVQAITGVSRNRLKEAYRRTGDLGDAAGEFYDPSQSVKNFFMRKKADTVAESASIERVHRMLHSIATVPQGVGSQKERHSLLLKLMRTSTSKEEVRFLTRALIGNMRLGATMKSIVAALAMAAQEVEMQTTVTPQDPVIQKLQKAYDICPRLDRIAHALLCGSISYALEKCSISVGIPIQPMLANPAHSLEEVEKFMTKKEFRSSTAVAEWKYDGMRCQAHYDGNTLKLFSRHLHDSTAQFPDVPTQILEARTSDNIHSFIIDSEVVAVAASSSDGGEGNCFRLLPFQVLSTRRTPGDAIQIRVFAFDLMYLNGVSFLEKPLFERFKVLKESFKETPGFTFTSSIELSSFDEEEISAYLQHAVKGGAEGLMMKLTGKDTGCDGGLQFSRDTPSTSLCTYESGTRSQTWLKVKRDYVKQFADTIDVVPIGAWHGNGRKAQKGFLSPVLLAVYDEDDDVFCSISRCMSFTDDMYNAVREFYFNGTRFPPSLRITDEKDDEGGCPESDADEDDQGRRQKPEDSSDKDSAIDDQLDDRVNCFPHRPSSAVYVTNEKPTIWFKPLEVWEVSFADLTLSRVHTAAAGLLDDPEGRGVAMRFPRFIRRRPDKSVHQATTSAQIAQLFAKQFKQA